MYQVKITRGLSENPDAVCIRTEVFVNEQHFVNEFDEIDEQALHFVLYDGALPIATGRTYPKESDVKTYILGRVAVIKDYRKHKLGSYLMRQMEEKAKELGAHTIELSAQVQAKPFYESLGYEGFGLPYADEGCPHIAMKKTLENINHQDC